MQKRLDELLMNFVLYNYCNGNINEMARRLEMNPSDFRQKIKERKKGHANFSVLSSTLALLLTDRTINLDALREKYLVYSMEPNGPCPYSKFIEKIVQGKS